MMMTLKSFKIFGSPWALIRQMTLNTEAILLKTWYLARFALSTPTRCYSTRIMMQSRMTVTKKEAWALIISNGLSKSSMIPASKATVFISCTFLQSFPQTLRILLLTHFTHHNRAHIPPTSKKDKPYYTSACTEEYFTLLGEYEDVIAAHFAGHYNSKYNIDAKDQNVAHTTQPLA